MQKLEEISKSIGFSYSKQEDGTIPNNNHYPYLFSHGHDQKAWNIMGNETKNGDLIKIFDYEYTEGSGRRRSRYDQTICLFSSRQIDLPAFRLRPDIRDLNMSNKFGFRLFALIFRVMFWPFGRSLWKFIIQRANKPTYEGYEDIDFESNPDFSDHYRLTGKLDAEQPLHSNEEKVRNIFNKNMLDFYEKNVGICTEAVDKTLIYYRHDKRVSPENIEGFLKEGIKVLSLFTTSQLAKGESQQVHSQNEPPGH